MKDPQKKPKVGIKQDGSNTARYEQQIIDVSPIGTLITRVSDGTIMYANKAIGDLLGIQDIKPIIGTPVPNFYWDSEERKTVVSRFRTDGFLTGYEMRARRMDDSMFWVSISLRPFQFEGETTILSTITDISERKKAEEALQASEERFRTIYDNTTIGLYRTTPDGRILMINPTGVRMMGYDSFDEIAKLNVEQAGYEQDDARGKFREKIESEGHVNDFESRWKRKDGSTIIVRESAKAFRDENGKVLYYEGSFEDITERKRAEQALSESEERFRRFTEATVEGLVFHERGVILDVNPAVLAMIGLSKPEELIGRNLLEFIVPEAHQMVLQKMQSQTVAPYEVGCIHKDGFVFPIETSTRAYKFGDREIRASSMRDITERKQAEQTLRESEARYSAVVNQANDGVIIIQNNTCQFANKILGDMLGYTPEEMQGTPFINYVAPESRALIAGRVKARLAGEDVPSVYEAKLQRKDGTVIDAELSAGVIQYRGNSADVGIIRDITGRKQAEYALFEANAKTQAVLDAATQEAIISTDPNGVITVFNTGAERMLGYSAKEMVGKQTPAIMHLESEVVARGKELTAEFGRPIEGFDIFVEYARQGKYEERDWTYVRKDGTHLTVSLAVTASRDGEGNIIGFLGVAHNITERKQAESEVQKNQQLLQSFLNNFPDGAFAKDLEGRFMIINRYAVEDIYGTTIDKVIGKTVYDTFPQDVADSLWESEKRLLETGETIAVEEDVPHANGQVRKKLTTKFPLYDADGNINGLGGVLFDITERKQMEEGLLLRDRALASSINAILIISPDLKPIYVNEAFLKLFGYTPEEALQLNPADTTATPEESQKAFSAMQSQGFYIGESLAKRKDGSIFPVNFSASLITNAEGQPIASQVSFVDITERKQAEAQIERNLRETRVRYEVSQALAGTQTEDDVLDVLGQHAGLYPQAAVMFYTFDRQGDDIAVILRRDDAFESGIAATMPVGTRFPASQFPLLNLFSADKPFVSNDFLADERVDPATRQMAQQGEATSMAAFPLTVGGEWMGIITLTAKLAGYFDEAKQHLYQTLAELGAAALQTARLRDQIQDSMTRRGYQVQISTEISQEVATASELSDLFSRVVTLTKERLGYYHTQLLRYDPTQDAVVLINGYGETGQEMLAGGHKMPMGEGLIGTAAASGETVMRSILAEDPDWQPNPLLPETKGEIAVPIKWQDTVLGVLDVQSDQAGALTEDDRLLLEGLCGQVAAAIEQTRLRQEMAERLEEVNRLYRTMSHEGWKTYRETTELPAGFVYDQAGIKPVDETVLVDESFADIPMRVLGGEVVGTLAIANDPQHPTSPEDHVFLQQVSDQIALALESARLFGQTQSALAQSEVLFEAGGRMAQAADLQELVSTVVSTLNIPEINRALMVTFNYSPTGDLEGLDVIANWWNGSGHEATAVGTHYPLEAVKAMALFLTSTPAFFNDVFNDERVDPLSMELVKRLNLRAVAALPLHSGTRQIGALLLEAEEPHNFTQDETRLYIALAPQITTVLENRRQFERAQKQAERESMLNLISQKIQSATTVEAVLQIAARELGHALGAPMTIAQLSMKDKK